MQTITDIIEGLRAAREHSVVEEGAKHILSCSSPKSSGRNVTSLGTLARSGDAVN